MKTNKKKMFFPAAKKSTIDSYIIFPRCPLIFRLDFRRNLSYLFLLQTKRIKKQTKIKKITKKHRFLRAVFFYFLFQDIIPDKQSPGTHQKPDVAPDRTHRQFPV